MHALRQIINLKILFTYKFNTIKMISLLYPKSEREILYNQLEITERCIFLRNQYIDHFFRELNKWKCSAAFTKYLR